MRKPFDKTLFEQNDKQAREAAKLVLKDYVVKDNPKRYGVDLLVYDNSENLLFTVECEVKRVWKKKFLYTDVQFPERKGKMAASAKTYFMMFNNDFSEFLVVKGEDLLNSPLEIVPNKYVQYGEKFYKVPLTKVIFNEFKE